MTAAPTRQDNDIRKFEEIGTISVAPFAAINEAIAFHRAVGADRKAARLRYLTMRWVNKLRPNPRIQIHSNLEHTYGLALVGIEGIKATDINRFLWDKYRIITTAVTRDDYQGIRVTPKTAVAQWMGEALDLGLAIDALMRKKSRTFRPERRPPDERPHATRTGIL